MENILFLTPLLAVFQAQIFKILRAISFKLIYKEMEFKDLIEYEKHSKKFNIPIFPKRKTK